MKYVTNLLILIFFYFSLSGQTAAVRFSGKLSGKEKTQQIHIYNIDGTDISVPVRANNTFSIVTKQIPEGFYEVDQIGTVYLCPGYTLNIQPGKEGDYAFTGTGSLENNATRAAKAELAEFIPMNKGGELAQEAYYLDVPVFLQKLDSFQQKGEVIFNKSEDAFFRKYAALDLTFYRNKILTAYFTNYGTDLKKQQELYSMIDTMDLKSPGNFRKIDSLRKVSRVKVMNMAYSVKVMNLMYQDRDKNDEVLFRNSTWYRKAVTEFLHVELSFKKPDSVRKKHLPEDEDIKLLGIARTKFSASPFILSYYNYNFTSSILQLTKDMAVVNKYYQEYLKIPSREDYLSSITELARNAVNYTDNMPAPRFVYRNIAGKPVSLESLRGKYVYIDVWATWCGPCKAEIPYLQKTEAANRDKNIQFVSISVDEQQDKGKWKEYVAQKHLEGIQLMADSAFESTFIKKMGINAIPRFILIDPSGKIVSANALRPSDTALQDVLNSLPLSASSQQVEKSRD